MGMNWTEEEYMDYLARKGKKTVKDKKPKRQKYNAKHTWVDGIHFHSQKEATHYKALKLLTKIGEIKGFCMQPKFILVEGDAENRAITYSSDFVVFHNDGTFEIQDVKGYASSQWERTYKQFRLKYPELNLKVITEV